MHNGVLALRSLVRVPALAVLLAFSIAGQARAQNPSPEELARRHHERGTTFYNLGQFEEAISEFRKGYEQKGDPVFLLNIGEAYRQLGAHEKALFFYRRYLSAMPAAPNRAEIDEKVAALQQLVDAQQRARSPAPPQPLPPRLTDGPPLVPSQTENGLVSHPPPPPGPLWQRWWFWAGVGGLVAGGIAVGLLVSSAHQTKPPPTDLGTVRFF
jgi:tetratricopeptide (TPR) repeat protein